jgi:hypothetical protein
MMDNTGPLCRLFVHSANEGNNKLHIKLLSTCAYFDRIAFWLEVPIDAATKAELKRGCGDVYAHPRRQWSTIDPKYRQRVILYQPNAAALQWLATRKDAWINAVEIAVDFAFPNLSDAEAAFWYFHHHLIRRRHGRQQKITLVGSERAATLCDNYGASPPTRKVKLQDWHLPDALTRYDAGRGAATIIAMYVCKYCRITKEPHCLHLETRLNGKDAVERAGIRNGQDLLDFNHHAFWKQRLLLVTIEDEEKLGRLVRNRNEGGKSRKSPLRPYGSLPPLNIDARLGHILLVNADDCMQKLIDQFGYGSRYRLQRAMIELPTEPWLPAPALAHTGTPPVRFAADPSTTPSR